MLQENPAQPWRQWLLLALTVGLAAAVALSIALAGEADAQKKTDIVVGPRGGDYKTIQEAVDAAEPGSTIKVLRGTYKEEVVIPKDLTLEGDGVDKTIIRAPTELKKFFATHNPGPGGDNFRLTAVVRITDGAQVNLSGVTVKGPIPCATEVSGIQVLKNATLNLSDSSISRLRAERCADSREAKGRGIVVGLPPHIKTDEGESGSTAHGTITNVAVDKYRAAGITVTGPRDEPHSTATISHNTVTGGVIDPITTQAGIWVDGRAVVQVKENTVSANKCTPPKSAPDLCGPDPLTQAQSMGILILASTTGSKEISQNHVSDNDVGVYQFASSNCCTISQNTLRNNDFFGIVIQDGDGTTSQNTITGGQVGIGVVATTVNTVGLLQGDVITNTSVKPTQEIECCGFDAKAQVQKA